MFQLMEVIIKENKNNHICYINKEDLAFDFIKTGKDLNDYVLSQKKGKTYVFIDEIQDIDGFESALRSLLLDKDLDIYNKNLYSVDCINNKHMFYHFDSYGRMHTYFTRLRSFIRKNCVLMDGKETCEIDISNSQPLFLTKLIKHLLYFTLQ
jgi:hypothetical protein